jgi:hypothetical protein
MTGSGKHGGKAARGARPPVAFVLARRRKLASSAAYLLLFSLLAAFVVGQPSGWMPGPLSEEHAFTGDRCDSCHAPASDDVESRCSNCHNDATLDRGWREHRREDMGLTTGASVPAGTLSRAVGGAGMVALAGAASGILVLLASARGPLSRRTRKRPKGAARKQIGQRMKLEERRMRDLGVGGGEGVRMAGLPPVPVAPPAPTAPPAPPTPPAPPVPPAAPLAAARADTHAAVPGHPGPGEW